MRGESALLSLLGELGTEGPRVDPLRGRVRLKALHFGERSPGDASLSGGERNDRDIPLRLEGRPAPQLGGERLWRFVLLSDRSTRAYARVRAKESYVRRSEVAIPAVGDIPKSALAALRVLGWREAELARQSTATADGLADCRNLRRGGLRFDARHLREPPARVMAQRFR